MTTCLICDAPLTPGVRCTCGVLVDAEPSAAVTAPLPASVVPPPAAPTAPSRPPATPSTPGGDERLVPDRSDRLVPGGGASSSADWLGRTPEATDGAPYDAPVSRRRTVGGSGAGTPGTHSPTAPIPAGPTMPVAPSGGWSPPPASPSPAGAAAPAGGPRTTTGSAAPTATRTAASGSSFVGVVTGQVSVDAITHRLWGWKVLAPLLALTFLLVLVVGGHDALESGLLGALLAAFFPLLVMIGLALYFTRRSPTLGNLTSSLVTSTAQGAGRAMVRGATATVGGAARFGSRGSISEQTVSVRRFRVQSPFGTVQSCLMVGELDGDELRSGDVVRVHGRVHRKGHRTTRRVEILQGTDGPTITTVTAGTPGVLRMGRAVDVLARVLCLGLLVLDVVILRSWR